jgi:hypothetical protein
MAVFLLWAFTNSFHGGSFPPLLGLLFAPCPTLAYVLVYAAVGPHVLLGTARPAQCWTG